LKSSKPDIACLQELKADQAEFPEAAFAKVGYSAALGRAAYVERRGQADL